MINLQRQGVAPPQHRYQLSIRGCGTDATTHNYQPVSKGGVAHAQCMESLLVSKILAQCKGFMYPQCIGSMLSAWDPRILPGIHESPVHGMHATLVRGIHAQCMGSKLITGDPCSLQGIHAQCTGSMLSARDSCILSASDPC